MQTEHDLEEALVRSDPVVLAMSNSADLKAVYGEEAKTIYSQSKTKSFFRTSSDVSVHQVWKRSPDANRR